MEFTEHFFPFLFFFFSPLNLFIYFLLCWVFVSVRGLSLVVASGAHSSSRCAGLSLSRPLLLRSTGSRRAGSVIVAHGPSRSAACGIFPDQGSNLCPLHWQADSQPLRHQGSPPFLFNEYICECVSLWFTFLHKIHTHRMHSVVSACCVPDSVPLAFCIRRKQRRLCFLEEEFFICVFFSGTQSLLCFLLI